MTVKRNRDGSVTIRNQSGTVAIGRVVFASDDSFKQKYEQWIEDCARLVTAGTHTFEETEKYFLEQCDTLPVSSDNIHLKSYKYSLIMNYFKDKLEYQAADFSFEMTDKEMEKWHRENSAMQEEVRNSPPERFGLNLKGYLLPNTERNRSFYKEASMQAQKHIQHSEAKQQVDMPNIYFFFEDTTENIEASGGGASLMNQLIIFRGISQDDINKRTPKFLSYINSLREVGKLADFR